MAKRHNEFSQLLGTVENGTMPMSDVPNLSDVANTLEADAEYHSQNMKMHADRLRKLGQMQPRFDKGGVSG